jgi:hypothetical protein
MKMLIARPPRRVPAWLAHLLTGKGPVNMVTKARGRTGFTEGLG